MQRFYHFSSKVLTASVMTSLIMVCAPLAARGDVTIFDNTTGTDSLGSYIVGLYPPAYEGEPDQVYQIGFNFTVPTGGSDYLLSSASLVASLDPVLQGGSSNAMTVQLWNSNGSVPGIAIETWTLNNLQATPANIQFNSVAHPALTAGAQYWLTASMVDSAATADWYTPNYQDNAQEAVRLNGAPFTVANLPRGAFSISAKSASTATSSTGAAVTFLSNVPPDPTTGLYNYQYSFNGLSGTGDIYVPIFGSDADDTGTITGSSGSADFAVNLPVGRATVGRAGASFVLDPTEVQDDWVAESGALAGGAPFFGIADAGEIAADDTVAGGLPIALMDIPENGDTSIDLSFTSNEAPGDGSFVGVDGDAIFSPQPGAVPEPASLGLLAAAGVLAIRRRGPFYRA